MPDYTLIVKGNEDELAVSAVPKVPTTPNSLIPSAPVSNSNSMSGGFAKRLTENTIERAFISPLNSATGGLASPAYQIGKSIATGGSKVAIGGGIAALAVAGVMLAVNAIEKRVAKMESKAEEMNNKDNTLIRAGTTSVATFYKGSLSGVSSTTSR